MTSLGLLALLAAAAAGPSPLDPVDDWVYVLQPDGPATVEAIAATEFDVAVIDPTEDGTAATEISPERIAALRHGGRVALAYLSIGEAETYRWYWDPTWDDEGEDDPDAPDWLGPVNPDFPDNRKVRYWDPDWQAILFGTPSGPTASSLDRILAQGFDGVYLDIVDAFEYWSEEVGEQSRTFARQEMVDLVQALAAHAGSRGAAGFLFVPQNGEAIVLADDYETLDALGFDWLATIDAVGIEDLYWNELDPQPTEAIEYRSAILAEYLAAGAEVLVTDYVWEPAAGSSPGQVARVDDFATRSVAAGLVPYVAVRDRSLDEILEIAPGSGFAVPQPRGDLGAVFRDGFESGDLSGWS